jgi:hypothetical protein
MCRAAREPRPPGSPSVTPRDGCYHVCSMAGFDLSKWYLDCVDEAGDVAVLYTGAARWGAFRLHYSSVLESRGNSLGTRYTLRSADPDVAGDSLVWRSAALGVEGEWHADARALRATVFAGDGGSVEWHCLMPRARARVGRLAGLGYAEHLAMTVAPWKLPLDTLRWGRFTSPEDWLVWIDWRGDFATTLVYRNGKESRTTAIEDSRIEFADGSSLVMDRSLAIREGRLGSTALSAIPGIRGSVPGRARFEQPGVPAVEGWAIHEAVEWPK